MVTSTNDIGGATWDEARAFGSGAAALDDDHLAEFIESHARERMDQGRAVSLGFYMAAIPDLAERAVPLDAAIDLALRWLLRQGHTPSAARDRLLSSYPALVGPIQDAAVLGEALVATSDLRRCIEAGGDRALPCDFGPAAGEARCRFELIELLGAGAGGRVYRAVDRVLSDQGFQAVVAVKVFDAVEATSWGRERFVEEASKARRVQHPNVVRVLDRGVSDDGEDFIVYEFVDGGTLQDWAGSQPRRPLRESVAIAAGIARGVQAAHSAGVVHCDLKPANVLMDAKGSPRVADFGVAVRREAWAEKVDLVVTDRPVGNLAFISPEQYRMEPGSAAPSSDVYAVGGLLYWLLTGTLPNGATLAEIERRHGDPAARPPSLRAGGTQADADLDAVCARALARDPQERYQSAAQFADDLESWLRHHPIRWTRPSASRVARLWVRRRPGLATTLSLLLVVGVVSAAVIWRLQSAATLSRALAAAADERVKIREEERKKALQEAKRYLQLLSPMMDRMKPWEALPLVPYFDWVLGTTVLGDPQNDKVVWQDRIALIKPMLDSARAREGDMGFETLTLEMTLGFWLLVERRTAEAQPLIARARAGWMSVLPSDPTVQRWCSVLAAVAEAQAENGGGAAPGTAATLRSAAAQLTDGPTESALRRLVTRTLKELEAPRPVRPSSRKGPP